MSAITQSTPLFARIIALGFAPSNGEARRLVRAKRVTLNGAVATDEAAMVAESDEISLIDRSAP